MQHENQAHIKVVKCQRKSRSNRSSSKKQQQLVVAVVVAAAAAAVVVVVVTLQVFVQESYNLQTSITKTFSSFYPRFYYCEMPFSYFNTLCFG